MARRFVAKKQELDAVHRAIKEFMSNAAPTMLSDMKKDDPPLTMEDALQGIVLAPRPVDDASIEKLGKALISAVVAAGDDPQLWKMLALTVIQRRYHSKAPEAKAIKETLKTATKSDDNGSTNTTTTTTSTTGDGERLTFYLILVYLQYIVCGTDKSDNGTTKEDKDETVRVDFAQKISTCLTRLAMAAGGSRDVCALIEHFLYQDLDKSDILQMRKDEGNKIALCQAVKTFVQPLSDTQEDEEGVSTTTTTTITTTSPVSPILKELIKVAANLIDEDITLIDTKIQAISSDVPTTTDTKGDVSNKRKKAEERLQSTINTFIPHNGRGSKIRSRNVVQSIAELMIWSQTSCSSEAFSKPLSDIVGLSCPDDNDKIISCVHVMQTAIRRWRQKLNASAREQGFSLCTLFQMDDGAITLNMVKRAKEGDVTRLKQLASKAEKPSILSLIAHRSTDPAKAIPAESITALSNSWKRIETKDETDEVYQLQLQIQEATVKATIDLLRRSIPEPASSETKASSKSVIASLDQSAYGDGSAILVAAALDDRCVIAKEEPSSSSSTSSSPCASSDSPSDNTNTVSLFIGEEECNVSSFEAVMKALDVAFSKERSESEGNDDNQPATTKHIQNVIERHVGPGENLLLFTSSDVKLEQRVLQSLQEQKSTIHCRIIDLYSVRMSREKAKVGDMTATLLWDCEADLDIHAICPNGDHIYHGKRNGGGGYLDVDMNASGNYSKEPVENIFWGDAEKGIQAEKGKYKIYVQNYAYHGATVKSGEPVPWRVRLLMDGKKYEFNGQCVGSGESSNIPVVAFEYFGRTAPAPEETGSAVTSSNLVSVTSSTGVTLDSISQLMKLQDQVEQLNRVRELVAMDADDATEEKEDADSNSPTRPLMAERNAFDVTSRDRLYLTLSKLPISFHLECDRCFEGSASLVEYTASLLAKRLIKDNVHVTALKDAGYPQNLVEAVQKKMLKFGI